MVDASFVIPDQWKFDDSIDDISYQQYVNSKPWVYYNYIRNPARRPDWITNPNEQTAA